MLFTGFAWSDKTLSWLAVAGADGYDVWVIKDEVQKGSVRNTSAASIDLTSDIESYGDGTYYVRVMAYKLESGNYLAEGSSPVKIIDTTPTYSVTINAGANMTLASGNANQSGLSGAMTDTVYTAADGYYFPTGYSVAAVNGITVTRNSYTQITVSGTPAANTTITLTSATAKTKEATPTATFDAQGTDFGNLLNWPTGMKYSVDGGITWTENTSSYNYKAIYDVSDDRDIKVYMPASDPTKLDSDIQTIDVTKAATPTGVIGVACTTSENNDGKLQNVTNAMQYKKSDASGWTDCAGTEVTGLANGTYYVRIKASGTALASDDQTVTVAAYIAPKTLSSIAVTTAPTKVTYTAGEYFDTSGMVVTATYSDGSTEAVVSYTFTPAGALTTGDTSITISYTEGGVTKTATQAITVNAAPKTLSSIAVTTAPAKVTYTAGENFDPTGMVVTATYSDSSTAVVTATVTDGTALTAGKTSVTISYTEGGVTKTATQAITVNAALPEFTITFGGNGGTPSTSNMTTTGQKLASLPTPTRSGSYSFKGWYTEVSGGTQVTTDTVFTADTTIYAQWNYTGSTGGGGGGSATATTYTVTFETNGGSKVSSKTVTKNTAVSEPTAPTKDGFEFNGWYTDKELKTAYDFSEKVTKSFTLYAEWTEKETDPDKPTEPTEPVEPTEPTTPGWENPFTDVSEYDWFYDSVKYVTDNNLMNGTTATTFAPSENLTRGMLVAILYRAEGEPAVNKSIPFSDVDTNAYYANAVIWAQQNGIVNGVTENAFAPDSNITREQIAAIMYRYAKYKGYDVSVGENTNILSYTDAESISEYAIASMQYAVGSGLMKGKSASTLNPLDNATRAEIAAILRRFIEANK